MAARERPPPALLCFPRVCQCLFVAFAGGGYNCPASFAKLRSGPAEPLAQGKGMHLEWRESHCGIGSRFIVWRDHYGS